MNNKAKGSSFTNSSLYGIQGAVSVAFYVAMESLLKNLKKQAFSLLTFFCRLYRRQLLYCCPPRIAPLIAGNRIDLTHVTIE